MSWFLLNRNLTPLEPYDWKLSRTVLRGERGSNASDLPGNSMLADIPSYKLDSLLELKHRYHIMLLSNTNSIHWQWAVRNRFRYKGLEVEDFFDRIYLSYELHMQKPDKEIFKYVLEDAGIAPEETFFIDDSVANCSAAEQLGIRTYCCPAGSDWRFLFEKDGAS